MSNLQNNKLFRYLSAFSGNEIILFLGSFISFPIFTRIFTKSDYGIMAIITITIAIFSHISGLGLKEAILRFYSSYAGEKRRIFLSTIFNFSILSSVACMFLLVGVLFSLRLFFAELTFQLVLLVSFSSLLLIFRSIIANITAVYRIEEKVRNVILIEIFSRYAGLMASVSLVFVFRNLYGYFAGIVLAEGILAIFLTWNLRNKISFRCIDFSILPKAIKYGFPLSVSNLSSFFLTSGDRYVVGYFLGASAVATYTVAYNLCNYIFELIKNVFFKTFMPLVINHWNSGEMAESQELLALHFRLYLMVSIPVIFGISSVGTDALSLLAGSKYADAYFLIPVLASAIAVNGLSHVTFSGLYFKSRSKVILMITVICAILNLLLNIALLPILGIIGAAWATGISYVAMVGAGYLFTRSNLEIKYRIINIIKYLFASAIMTIIIWQIHISGNVGLLIKIVTGGFSYLILLTIVDFRFLKKGISSFKRNDRMPA